MKKTMKQHSFTSQLKSLALVFGIALTFASCTNEDVVQNPTTNPNEDNNKNLTTFVAGDETKTRTSMDYNSGNFYWEAGDHICVKDDDGVLRWSMNAPTSKVASFKYKVPGKFTAKTSYKVYYLGTKSSGNSVRISTSQRQPAPDNTAHFGIDGDYGTATATKVIGKNQFEFVLEHQPAYLVFQPYTNNTALKKCYLTQIEVSSNNDIAEEYDVVAAGLKNFSVSTPQRIVLITRDWTSGSSIYYNGFPLTNSTASVTTNGAYMVIKPGTHTLKVRYWVKDVVTGVEGAITKTLPSKKYEPNTYYDMEADLNVKDYDGDHYYQWDAKDQYWKGYEWTKNLASGVGQPTLMHGLPGETASSNYAQSNSDPRYFNDNNAPALDATYSCAGLPNVNEMTWYAASSPRWDGEELWTAMGHLYKGGIWFRKKAYISGYKSNKAVDGTDWRTTANRYHWSPSSTLPSAAEASKYFFLPTLGCYSDYGHYGISKLYGIGFYGYYWSSSAVVGGVYAFLMSFDGAYINVSPIENNAMRRDGFRVEPTFE